MNTVIMPETKPVMETLHSYPAVSIILPFEPKMSLKTKLAHTLNLATEKVEHDLSENYPEDIDILVMQKLRAVIKTLNFSTHKKSIAIYVSPMFEKVLYLNIAVEEKIIVEETFEIRDLLYSKKQLHEYLVLVLSTKESRIFTGNSDALELIVSNTIDPVYCDLNEVSDTVTNFHDISQRKDIEMGKFLQRIDNSLDIILDAYHLPLFVVGSKKLVDQFKNLTSHAGVVIEFVQCNKKQITFEQIKEILKPFITDWSKVKQKDLLNQMAQADGKKKLAVGIKDVWHEAMGYKGRLLVLEKNYRKAGQYDNSDDLIYKAIGPFNKYSYIKNAVDEVIEKVFENGGDVEFVDDGVIKNYQHIALVQ